jgi:hypothetical protein
VTLDCGCTVQSIWDFRLIQQFADTTALKGDMIERFADKRKNGQLFALLPSDVAAFRRRDYQ